MHCNCTCDSQRASTGSQLTSAQQAVPLPIMPHKGGRLAVSAAEAQQPCTVVGGVKQPLLKGVVLSSAHQQRLPRKEVQGSQPRIMRVLQHVAQGRQQAYTCALQDTTASAPAQYKRIAAGGAQDSTLGNFLRQHELQHTQGSTLGSCKGWSLTLMMVCRRRSSRFHTVMTPAPPPAAIRGTPVPEHQTDSSF